MGDRHAIPLVIIADAGPVLHLHWIDASAWALPPQSIDVVDAVWREVEAYAPEALQDARLRRVPDPAVVPETVTRWGLDDGERAALSYALGRPDDHQILILCDDHQARRACADLALPVVGSIGLIGEAFRAGRVPLATAEAALRDLPGRGRLHVDGSLIEMAVAALHDALDAT